MNEISNIKVRNIYIGFSNITIKRNFGIIKRTIEEPLKIIFKLYINTNSLLLKDYFISPSIKKLQNIIRASFLEERYKTFINDIETFSKNALDNLINAIHR